MHYYQLGGHDDRRLAAVRDGTAYDLTAAASELGTFGDLVRTAGATDSTVDEVTMLHLDSAPEIDTRTVAAEKRLPLVPDEVWAAGVTYEISEAAREEESGMPEVYLDVYEAERPEIFFKATPGRTVGPNEAVGVRGDSSWNVPEPELAVVTYDGRIVGYTVGNDVSSREIEGDNPLYLPQAKVYDRCCSLGPCVASLGEVEDPHALEMTMRVHRDDSVAYEGATNTDQLVRTCEELTDYLTRHNVVPDLTVLLTGTALVPEGDFTLHEGDEVEIRIEDVGTLRNPVTRV